MKRLPAVRERTEELERASLSTWATLAVESKGRDLYEEADLVRTAFQCDRDRIMESNAFRRLKHKTHRILGGGHRRMRATHALEVTQIARTIGRGLRLNEDLIEAIALGHDVGNTAFADAGDEALSAFTPVPFRHEEQSLRVVEKLEDGGRGLNLTWEVRDGILSHGASGASPATLEGQAVRIADEIAAVTHDLRDAVKAGLLSADDIPVSVVAALGATHEARLAALIADVITESVDQPELTMSPRVEEARNSLRSTFEAALGRSSAIADERSRAIHCLSSLMVFLLEHADRVPGPAEDSVTKVCDAVSAYTDGQAVAEFNRLFLPSS